jgi:hypothetical protein
MAIFVDGGSYEDSFALFDRAAGKGHKQAKWLLSAVKNVVRDRQALKEAFAKTETPLGWCLAGRCGHWGSEVAFSYTRKSAEAGCSWGMVELALYYQTGAGAGLVEKNEKLFVKWLEKAVQVKDCAAIAMDRMGHYLREQGDEEKALSYYQMAASLGWKVSMRWICFLLQRGPKKDWGLAAYWGAKGSGGSFCELLIWAKEAFEKRETEALDKEFDKLCYSLGWGLYWYLYETEGFDRLVWPGSKKRVIAFCKICMEFYLSMVELQRKSIFTFLWFWNSSVGVKDVGVIIGKMVWEEERESWLDGLWR